MEFSENNWPESEAGKALVPSWISFFRHILFPYTKLLSLCILHLHIHNSDLKFKFSGPEHKELQVSKMAMFAEFQQYASLVVDWNSATEQSDGVVVPDALPHAPCVPVTQGLQRMVCQPSHWHDRGEP